MAYVRSFQCAIALALLFFLNGCGLILETTPAPGPTDSGHSDATRGDAGDAGREDSGATDSGTDDSGPPPVIDAGPAGCSSSEECDDENPCTTDECIASACENTENSASCDDGVFCNGPDTCDEGSCSVHDDDPCSGGTICDEAVEACVGCVEDSDCPSEAVGAWGACEGFTGVCAESGTRTRIITSYACSSGTCVGTDRSESDGCTRSTDGTTCGLTVSSDWGTCRLFDTICDTSGSQTRMVTDYVCAAETCRESTRPYDRPCTRPSTTGTPCIMRTTCDYGTCSASELCFVPADMGNLCFGTSTACCGDGTCDITCL